MSKFSSFLRKFAPEYRAIGQALGTVILGVGLDPKDRANIQTVIDTVQTAADNIEGSLKAVEKAEAIGIDQKALEKAVKEYMAKALPDMLAGLSETALRAALTAKEAK